MADVKVQTKNIVPNIYDVWRAAEIILLEKRFDQLVSIDDTTVEYQAKDSYWPAKGMRITTNRTDNSTTFQWKSTTSTYKTIIYFDGKIPDVDIPDFSISVLKQIYDTYGLICAEISGMLRLFTPYLVSVKDYGNFETLIGYSVTSLFGGVCPTGHEISEIRDIYSSLLSQILPGIDTVNPLFKALRNEGDVVIALLGALGNGWRLSVSSKNMRIKTPDGVTFEMSMLNVIHIAAKDPTLCVDLSKLLKTV